MIDHTLSLAPLGGILVGILLIIFRDPACSFLQWTYEKFPRYEDGTRALYVTLKIRPIFIVVLAIIIIVFSLVGFIISL